MARLYCLDLCCSLSSNIKAKIFSKLQLFPQEGMESQAYLRSESFVSGLYLGSSSSSSPQFYAHTRANLFFQLLSFMKMKDEEWIEILPIHLIFFFISQMLRSKIVTEANH